jgi:hypothetical protein
MTFSAMDSRTTGRVARMSELVMDMDATLSFEPSVSRKRQLWETRHFRRLIEAILFVVEEMPRERRWSAWIRCGDQTINWAQIKAEYHRRTDGV